jgi:hypothetical protein
MRKIAILGAAVLATALAGPSMAKEMKTHPRHTAHQTMQQQDANAGWSNGWNGERRESGFWPGDVAAGAVGAAVGTAGAIATAPFRGPGDAYAYDNRYAAAPPPVALERGDASYYDRGENGWYGDWNSYAAHNGISCRPGTMFKDGDRMRPCQ